MMFLDNRRNVTVHLRRNSQRPERCHVFEEKSIQAVNAALAAGRPLLLLGEPGVGKSQLARAVAKRLGRVFVSTVIDSHTESRDLLYSYDAVQRLADAQVKAALASVPGSDTTAESLARELATERYLHPGPLWWAFDWLSLIAAPAVGNDQEEKNVQTRFTPPPQELDGAGDPANGAVLLIDEIDKGQPELPNGLLGALGDGEFSVPGRADPVKIVGEAPLIMVTSNDERDLPPAFVRRCLVFRLTLPKGRDALLDYLCMLGKEHQPDQCEKVQLDAAEQLFTDRECAEQLGVQPLPGLAEYLDMLRALQKLYPNNMGVQREALADIALFTSGKHTQLRP